MAPKTPGQKDDARPFPPPKAPVLMSVDDLINMPGRMKRPGKVNCDQFKVFQFHRVTLTSCLPRRVVFCDVRDV